MQQDYSCNGCIIKRRMENAGTSIDERSLKASVRVLIRKILVNFTAVS